MRLRGQIARLLLGVAVIVANTLIVLLLDWPQWADLLSATLAGFIVFWAVFTLACPRMQS